MRIVVKTAVFSSMEKIKDGFTSELFLKLSPPFPSVKLINFDGCSVGDLVSLRLNFVLFCQLWTSEIISEEQSHGEWSFVDKGIALPFFLKDWRHHHRILKVSESESTIIDDVNYSSGNVVIDVILFIPFYLQFLYRKPVYRRVFRDRK